MDLRLHTFRKVPYFRILVCGGDGTVGWVLGVLEEIRHKLNCPVPPVAVLPLGTGNDLARVLRWGPGYSGEDPFSILVAVDEAEEVLMDRWTILIDAQEIIDGTENGVPELEPPKIVQMNNYCGIGIDAELSLDFHQAREEDPDKFNSSWGSGADLWGSDSDGRFNRPQMDDGMLEVVGVTGVVHMKLGLEMPGEVKGETCSSKQPFNPLHDGETKPEDDSNKQKTEDKPEEEHDYHRNDEQVVFSNPFFTKHKLY
ncbi:hypothetical protein scyTo_0018025 [Scyliorhinus torazame]|uniref:Diacylglycerol kinase n=1 Tax=Scyliorhinus torazame TaxID=75743 RepID=A0A401Q449_SCYTO|nr:hypothetical protein [Scyliorhinus torazame]